jgi:hypothetical protein
MKPLFEIGLAEISRLPMEQVWRYFDMNYREKIGKVILPLHPIAAVGRTLDNSDWPFKNEGPPSTSSQKLWDKRRKEIFNYLSMLDRAKRTPNCTPADVKNWLGTTIILIQVDNRLYLLDARRDDIPAIRDDGSICDWMNRCTKSSGFGSHWELYWDYGICAFMGYKSTLKCFVIDPKEVDDLLSHFENEKVREWLISLLGISAEIPSMQDIVGVPDSSFTPVSQITKQGDQETINLNKLRVKLELMSWNALQTYKSKVGIKARKKKVIIAELLTVRQGSLPGILGEDL